MVRRIANNEREYRQARDHYTYRQSFEFREEGGGGFIAVSDVTFTPEGKRIEKPLKTPVNALKRIILTDEDFRDLAEVQPFVLDPDDLWNYEVRYVAQQVLEGRSTLMLEIRPRQLFEGQRLFQGTIWVTHDGLQVVQVEGKAVPNLVKRGKENLFPHFTTIRTQVDGKNWFPVLTYADDTLQFRTGPIRVHFTIKYADYKRFGAESTIRFEKP